MTSLEPSYQPASAPGFVPIPLLRTLQCCGADRLPGVLCDQSRPAITL